MSSPMICTREVKPLKMKNADPSGTSELEVGIVSAEEVDLQMSTRWTRIFNRGANTIPTNKESRFSSPTSGGLERGKTTRRCKILLVSNICAKTKGWKGDDVHPVH